MGAAIVQQLNNSLTGTITFLFFSFPFPLYLLIIFSFFDLYLCMLSKISFLSSNFLHLNKFHLSIFNRDVFDVLFFSRCANRVKLAQGNSTWGIESGNYAVGITSLYRYSLCFNSFLYISLQFFVMSMDNTMCPNLLSKIKSLWNHASQ